MKGYGSARFADPREASRSRNTPPEIITMCGCPISHRAADLVHEARTAANEKAWSHFERKFRSEMNEPDAAKVLDLLAALSHSTNFSIGCYCEDENRCHRSVLQRVACRTWRTASPAFRRHGSVTGYITGVAEVGISGGGQGPRTTG